MPAPTTIASQELVVSLIFSLETCCGHAAPTDMLRHFTALLMAATLAGAAMAQASDRPQSAACRDALDDVQAQETRALAVRQSPTDASGPEGARVSAGLQAARERAAR